VSGNDLLVAATIGIVLVVVFVFLGVTWAMRNRNRRGH
jgi:heme/copper-type cytochrome/quinol oxidase subunit 2